MILDIVLSLALLIVLAGAGMFIAMQARQQRAAEASGERMLQTLRGSLDQQLADRDRLVQDLRGQLEQARTEAAQQAQHWRTQFDAAVEANSALRADKASLNTALQQQAAQARQQLADAQRHAQDKQQHAEITRKQMSDEFKALASDALRSQSDTFTKQNKEQIDLLLKPLGDKIVEFQSGLVKDRAELVEQVRTLHSTSQDMRLEATNLTRALKGNAQVQGAWGEMILTSILERSGLRKGEQFQTQESHALDEGGRVRTDVEILMPNGDKVIIDSKVSLTAFEAHVNAEKDDERSAHLRSHIQSVRGHVKTLSGKEYHRHAGSGLDFVLMFVPIESAFATALSADAALLDFAFEQNVVIVTPTTLMSALRTIRNFWQVELRQRNAEEIADRAGKLYEKVAGFLDSMDKIDDQMVRARTAFDAAKKQLSTGPGNVVRQIEMLKELGAKTNKQIGGDWQSSDAVRDEAQRGQPTLLLEVAEQG